MKNVSHLPRVVRGVHHEDRRHDVRGDVLRKEAFPLVGWGVGGEASFVSASASSNVPHRIRALKRVPVLEVSSS